MFCLSASMHMVAYIASVDFELAKCMPSEVWFALLLSMALFAACPPHSPCIALCCP